MRLGWNRIIWERLSGDRIPDRNRKDALPLVVAEYSIERRRARCALPQSFVVREEEKLVAPDGSAQGPTELVEFERALVGCEIGPRIEHVVAQKLVQRAVKRVRATSGDDIDDRSAALSEFRGRKAGLYFELGDGIDRRRNSVTTAAVLAVVDSVNLIVVLLGPLSCAGWDSGSASDLRAAEVSRGRV